ncbi:MAG: hypothetical protein HQ521_12180 [Bacteroidetes bacterium]|nr:hypothetical protein [Bacteroidota bacterium]
MEEKKDIVFPGWDAVETERNEEAPVIIVTIKDSAENIIRRIEGPTGKGFHRVAWDLRTPASQAININSKSVFDSYSSSGFLVTPGTYTASLSKRIDGKVTELSESVTIKVKKLYDGELEGSSSKEVTAFWNEINRMQMSTSALNIVLDNAIRKVAGMKKAFAITNLKDDSINGEIFKLNQQLIDIREKLYGNGSKDQIGEKNNPTVMSRLSAASMGVQNSTYGPTPTHVKSLEIAKTEFVDIKTKLENIVNIQIPKVEKQLIDAGAPWMEGQEMPID